MEGHSLDSVYPDHVTNPAISRAVSRSGFADASSEALETSRGI
ncbi:hypothetical protein BDD21_4588 [Thiocapsa rosea]|uniref:Uncharacterized protein n=1 Tax=Thiocapsa rosea TaxID=69360 RepID=A0A495VCH4_9GAMM|nr:hypothetical protein BDD21_4588 [Thiocapsa rosea]